MALSIVADVSCAVSAIWIDSLVIGCFFVLVFKSDLTTLSIPYIPMGFWGFGVLGFWDETRQDWSLAIAGGTLWLVWTFGHQGAEFI